MIILAQALGVIALCIAIASFQQNAQKKIVTLQMLSSVFFCLHFCMLDAVLGGVLNGIGIFRAAIFRKRDAAWASHPFWLVLFCVVFIFAGICTWDGPISILPILSMILSTAAFWVKNARAVRFISLPASPLWFFYNLYYHSYPGMLTELFVFSSICIAVFRYDFFPRLTKTK